jgi:hypothetical protein
MSPACIIMPLGVLLSFSWVAFIALYWRLANTGPLEDFQRLWDISYAGLPLADSAGEMLASRSVRIYILST